MDDDRTRQLRQRVLDELALVQGRIALASNLDGQAAKEQLRLAHDNQRKARLEDAAEFLFEREPYLLQHFADGDELDPALADPVIIPVRTQGEADLFRFATLHWSVPVSAGYGRRSRFLVRDRHNEKLMGIFALGDPVIAQSARDEAIGWTTEQRNDRLYNVYDAYVLGAVEPYRQILGGKLMALLTLSNEVRGFLTRKYEGRTTEIRGEEKDPTPVLITTSSALGRSSVYNRVTYRGDTMLHSVGFTRGYGHFQFSDEVFALMRDYIADRAEDDEDSPSHPSSQYGSGPNWRFRVIRTALSLLGIDTESLQHNVRREVFLAPVAANWDEYLRGESDTPELFDLPAADIGTYWRERWAIDRAERRPGYRHWRREEARLTPELDQPVQMSMTFRPRALPGRVDFGRFHLSVGVDLQKVQGSTLGGSSCSGDAYLSHFEGAGMDITLADISWNNGEREVRGWSRDSSHPILEDLVGRLRIGVYETERYRGMSFMELRPAIRVEDRTTARMTTTGELSELLGFDAADELDGLLEATLGTREDLLRDDSRRRNQLCVVFRSDDFVIPATAWCLVRPLALLLREDPDVGQPKPPTVCRPAPKVTKLQLPDTEVESDAAAAV